MPSLQKIARYLTRSDAVSLRKWENYGFDPKIYHKHPNFVRWLFKTPLASQMKICRERITEINGEPALLVEGSPLPFSEFQKRFSTDYCPEFEETFIRERTTRAVYTFLDTGKGLVKHHPCLVGIATPFSVLSQEEYKRTLACANTFDRPNPSGEKREHIIQIVGTFWNSWNLNHPITGNLNRFIMSQRHPYIRMINPKGEVFSTGFTEKNPPKWQFLRAGLGKFRVPDFWEYKTTDFDHLVTNIAVSEQEANRWIEFTSTYQDKAFATGTWPIFSFLKHNCTTFVRNSINHALGIDLPTRRPIQEMLTKITPPFLKKFPCPSLRGRISKWIPDKVSEMAQRIWKTLLAICLLPIGLFFGGASEKKGPQFEKEFSFLRNPRNWLKLSQYDGDYPGALQEWQRKQTSTVIYHNQTKLCIAP